MARLSRLAALLLGALLVGCSAPTLRPGFYQAPLSAAQPESASGWTAKPGWAFTHMAVAAANPLAADAGLQVLQAGGSAVDAAVAVQMVLTLVEPQSSGIGGGAFLLHHDGRRVQAFDGRETAPAAATEKLFTGVDDQPLAFMDAVVGGRSVGTPGAVAMLALAHQQHGKLPWATLFEPAIVLAEQGFAVSPRLHALLSAESALKADQTAAAYFYRADGTPHPVGHLLRNPALARALRAISTQGPTALHTGPIAHAIVDKVHQHPTNPGQLTMDDLRRYRPVERAALCFDHEAAGQPLRVCGFPPPSSGAIAIGQILGLLARTPQGARGLSGTPDADWLHAYAEASRLAFADRALYLADPDKVSAPGGTWNSLLDPAYLDGRARLIGAQRMPQAPAGQPVGSAMSWAPMPEQTEYGTSHLSITDRFGNTLAMTTTIEAGFGARLMVGDPAVPGGFLLNNQLTDFSFAPRDAQGRPVANRVEAGKRPRSSMSPTLVFDRTGGNLLMSAGSPGGALIIHFTAKTLLGVLHGGLGPQAAIDLPNFATMGGPVLLEASRFPAATVRGLQQRGHTVSETPLPSGLQAIQRGVKDGRPVWFGGADPRREGIVAGD